MTETTNYAVGDTANGHVLTEQGWVPMPPVTPVTKNGAKKKGKGRKIALAVGGSLLGLLAIGSLAGGDSTATADTDPAGDPAGIVQEEAPAAEKAPVAEKAPAAEKAPEITRAQQNALRAAQNYLDTMPFSKAGLIEQLSSEYGSDFEKADAKWAVGQLDVDWNEQAVRAAENYLDTMAFSRNGLIEQLSSEYGSQFTKAQAVYAVNQLGL